MLSVRFLELNFERVTNGSATIWAARLALVMGFHLCQQFYFGKIQKDLPFQLAEGFLLGHLLKFENTASGGVTQ